MAKIKYAICSATFCLGSATGHARFLWFGGNKWVSNNIEWVDDVEEATFFDDEESCQNTYQSIVDFQTLHKCDESSLSIVTFLWYEDDE